MRDKRVIAAIIAVVALLAIGTVVALNNKNNKTPATSSTNTTQEEQTQDTTDTPPPTTDVPAPTPVPTPPPASGTATNKVTIEDFEFGPPQITIKKGTTVTWTNNDSVSHTVTGDNGGPDSELFGTGQSYSYTFNTVGVFDYHCQPHPQMTGKVTVTE